jgi:hypothetical protein
MTLGVSVAPTARPDLRGKIFSLACIKLPRTVENISVPTKGKQQTQIRNKGEHYVGKF